MLAAQGPADPDSRPARPAVKQTDPRVIRVQQFLAERDCPAHVYAEDFIRASTEHDLDWRLLPSLSLIESGGGKQAYNNNMFGWDSCRVRFNSRREGIYRVAANLGRSRLYRNKNIDQILRTYNPLRHYPRAVKSVMNQLGPAELTPRGAF